MQHIQKLLVGSFVLFGRPSVEISSNENYAVESENFENNDNLIPHHMWWLVAVCYFILCGAMRCDAILCAAIVSSKVDPCVEQTVNLIVHMMRIFFADSCMWL